MDILFNCTQYQIDFTDLCFKLIRFKKNAYSIFKKRPTGSLWLQWRFFAVIFIFIVSSNCSSICTIILMSCIRINGVMITIHTNQNHWLYQISFTITNALKLFRFWYECFIFVFVWYMKCAYGSFFFCIFLFVVPPVSFD